jgi:hypothetical protein
MRNWQGTRQDWRARGCEVTTGGLALVLCSALRLSSRVPSTATDVSERMAPAPNWNAYTRPRPHSQPLTSKSPIPVTPSSPGVTGRRGLGRERSYRSHRASRTNTSSGGATQTRSRARQVRLVDAGLLRGTDPVGRWHSGDHVPLLLRAGLDKGRPAGRGRLAEARRAAPGAALRRLRSVRRHRRPSLPRRPTIPGPNKLKRFWNRWDCKSHT